MTDTKPKQPRRKTKAASEDVLGAFEAAWFIGAHVETLRRLARRGEIPAYKVGKDWRFRRKALEHWCETHHLRSQPALDLVESALAATREALTRAQISLKMDLPDELPTVDCDRGQMERVLTSLIDNARDALNEKYPGHNDDKVIVLNAEVGTRNADGTWTSAPQRPRSTALDPKSEIASVRYPISDIRNRTVRLTVEDHGPGIPDAVRERLFDPFYTTKPRDKGTGLGLSISHGIIKDHHGELSVESEAGQWTRFHIDLPISDIGYRIGEG